MEKLSTSTSPASPGSASGLKRGTLGTPGVVFLVLAAVAPLTGTVVVASLAIALGNGGGTPFAFLVIAALFLIFAVGYAQMSRVLVNAGGFYAFVLKGLGRTGGLVAGLIATLGYNFFVVGTIGTSGFFMQTIIAQLTGLDVHWYVWGLLSIVASFLLARRGIDISSAVLGIALVLETLVLVVFDISVLVRTGFSVEAFSPDAIFSGSLPIGLLLAATAFLGFEATSLFGEEAKNPSRTVPRATYIAVGIIGVVFALTSWAVVSATGVAQAQSASQEHLESGDLLFSLAGQYLGDPLVKVMMVLLLVSLFAAMLAFHNSAARYLYALGRARVFPYALSRTNAGGSPVVACVVQAVFAVVVAGAFALAGLDPITSLVPSMIGFGTLCIMVLQVLAALAIIVHFRRQRDPRIGRTFVAPLIAMLGLGTIVVLAIINFDIVAGSDALAVRLLPLLLVVAVVGGLILGPYLKRKRPQVYAALAEDMDKAGLDDAAESEPLPSPAA